jgi:hypothetical protein
MTADRDGARLSVVISSCCVMLLYLFVHLICFWIYRRFVLVIVLEAPNRVNDALLGAEHIQFEVLSHGMTS